MKMYTVDNATLDTTKSWLTKSSRHNRGMPRKDLGTVTSVALVGFRLLRELHVLETLCSTTANNYRMLTLGRRHFQYLRLGTEDRGAFAIIQSC